MKPQPSVTALPELIMLSCFLWGFFFFFWIFHQSSRSTQNTLVVGSKSFRKSDALSLLQLPNIHAAVCGSVVQCVFIIELH